MKKPLFYLAIWTLFISLILIGDNKINLRNLLASLDYNSDPQNLADGQHVLFIDKNNPNCSDSYTRAQALNPATPWCGITVFGNYGTAVTSGFGLQPGDQILFKAGTYLRDVFYIANKGTSENYIVFKPYPGDVATISGYQKDGWTAFGTDSLGNNIYSINLPDGFSTSVSKRDDYIISRANSLDQMQNPPSIANSLDLYFYDSSAKVLYVRLVSGASSDIFFDGGMQIEQAKADHTGYVEITGLNIQHGYNGIKIQYGDDNLNLNSQAPGIKITNNNITACGQGVLGGGDNLTISGNTINKIGMPLELRADGNLYADNKDHALYIGSGSGEIFGNTLTNCYSTCATVSGSYSVYNNYIDTAETDNGYWTNSSIFYNNIIKNGLTVYSGNKGVLNLKVYNNLFSGSYGLGSILPSSNAIIDYRNNLVENNGTYCSQIQAFDYANSKFDYNLYGGCSDVMPGTYFSWIGGSHTFEQYISLMQANNSAFEVHSIYAGKTEALKLNGFTGLLAGSPALGAGTCLAEVTTDYYGNPRPSTNCDIGPFQVSQPTPVNGACGTASQTYASTATSFGTATFCLTGAANPASPAFPSAGSSVNWTCQGQDGGSNASCTASASAQNNARNSGGSGGGGGAINVSNVPSPISPILKSTSTSATPSNQALTNMPESQPAVVSPQLPSVSQTALVFTKKLYSGVKDEQVSVLQSFLAQDAEIYPEGRVTGYFGALTLKAVGKFQIKYGIVKNLYSAGYGVVGPKTMAKLNEMFYNLQNGGK